MKMPAGFLRRQFLYGPETPSAERSAHPSEAVPQRKLHAIVGRRVIRVPRLHGLVERVDTLRRLLGTAGNHVSSLRQQSGRAADRSAGVVLIREVLPSPSLVEQVEEVDDVEAELEVLLAKRPQVLSDTDVDVVLPRIAAGVATKELPAILAEAWDTINEAIERIGLG